MFQPRLADLFEAAGQFRQAVIHLKEYQTVHTSIAQDQAAAMLKTSELISSLERLRMEQASVVESEKREALANLAGALAHRLWPERPQATRRVPVVLLGFFLWGLYTTLIMFDMLVTFCVLLALVFTQQFHQLIGQPDTATACL